MVRLFLDHALSVSHSAQRLNSVISVIPPLFVRRAFNDFIPLVTKSFLTLITDVELQTFFGVEVFLYNSY